MTKVCIKCPGVGPQPLDHFYKRGDSDKVSNICKACTREAVNQRHREQMAGTFVNKHTVMVTELTGKLKPCNECTDEKDEAHFRPYTTTVKGKVYEYRANTCRDCEKDGAQAKRDRKRIFNEADYKSITDFY